MDTAADPGIRKSASLFATLAWGLIPVNFGLWWLAVSESLGVLQLVFSFVAFAQFVLGLAAIVQGVRARKTEQGANIGAAIAGGVAMVGAPLGWIVGIIGANLGGISGGAWGRPLRVRGTQLHCDLREGSDWTRGERPDPSGLDEPTRRALEVLWLHDAQKEHASVPAFSRVSWMLAAVGAPADLLEWCHRAAIEEIEHTRRCFALAAGYGGLSHSVQPMPELVASFGATDPGQDPLVVLAQESLADGCQLEDFNADVAAACASACREPVTRAVLEQIAAEERSHADLSWAILEWLLDDHPDTVAPALEGGLEALAAYPRPTAVGRDKAAIVRRAQPQQLLEHGRLPDARWAELWAERLGRTQSRLRPMLDTTPQARAS